MKNDIGQLGIKPVFMEVPVYFLQIGEQGIFFQFEINRSFCEPGLG
jgi:hypothetical protein